jgi:hypothetical protein
VPPTVLAPGARELVRLALRRQRGGAVTIELTAADPGGAPRSHRDALAADDSVRLVLPAPPAPRIAVLSDSDAPVLRAAAAALAAETGGEVVAADAASARASYVLVEGGAQRAEDWRGVRGILFGTRLLGEGAQPEPPPMLGAAIEWDRNDPLTAGLDFSELRVARLSAAVPAGALVSAGGQPLVTVSPDRRVVQCAFRLTDANLWLLAAFPQFLRRAFAAAHAEAAAVRLAEDNLLDAAESDLRAAAAGPGRPQPAFGNQPRDQTTAFALAALSFLLLRAVVSRPQ